MNAHLKIAATALCGMLLALPVAQAQQPQVKTLYVDLGTSESDFAVYPTDLALKVGENYRLVLVNWSREHRHAVMAPEFGKAVVTKSIRTLPDRAEMKAASFAYGIEVPPGARVELYFEPYKEGHFKLFCQEAVHTRAGMEVAIDVRL